MSGLEFRNSRKFLLTEGGPSFRLEKRLRLIQANRSHISRRSIICVLVTWVPLLILSILQHNATGHRIPVPFLRDFAVHARFLLAVPLLLLAETFLGPRLADAASHFVESGLVIEKDFKRFDSAIENGLKWRDSIPAEIVLIFLAYALTFTTLTSTAIHVSTWYAMRMTTGVSLTWAGWWFIVFCVPLFQFLTLRWLWRLFLWGQFLWRMNRLDLQLMPTHPDQAAGLGFIGESQRFFGIVLFAYSVAVAGVLANGVLYDQSPLSHYVPAISAYVIVAVILVLIPACVFARVLFQTKHLGLEQYGTLATTYTTSFHLKWIAAPHETQEPLLGTADIQSLADLGNSYSFIERMNPLPMGPRTPIHLALACLIPMVPLLLTMMPLGELIKMIVKVVL